MQRKAHGAMSSLVTEMDWEALIEILQETADVLQNHKMEPVKQGFLEVSSTASMLELEDLAQTVEGFKEYLLAEASQGWEEAKVAALRSTVLLLVSVMKKHFYGPELKEALKKIEIREAAPEEPPVAHSEPLAADFVVQEERAAPPVEPHISEEPHVQVELVIPIEVEAAPSAEDMEPSLALPAIEGEVPQQAEAESEEPQAAKEAEEVSAAVELKEDRGRETGHDMAESYRAFLNLDPASSIFVLLAEEYCKRGQWREAVMTCRRGLAAHPRDLRGRVLLGWALAELGQREEAKGWLTLVRRDIEANALVYEILARMADEQGDHKKAKELTAVFHTLQARFDEMPSLLSTPEFLEAPGASKPAALFPEAARPAESASVLSSIRNDLPAAPAHPPVEPEPVSGPVASSPVLETLTTWLNLLEKREACKAPQANTLFSGRERSLLRQLFQESAT